MELHPDPDTFGQPEVAIVAAPAPAILPSTPVSDAGVLSTAEPQPDEHEAPEREAPALEVEPAHVELRRTVLPRSQAEQDRAVLAADIRSEVRAAVKATHGLNVSILSEHSSYAESHELNGAKRIEQTINVR